MIRWPFRRRRHSLPRPDPGALADARAQLAESEQLLRREQQRRPEVERVAGDQRALRRDNHFVALIARALGEHK